MRVSGSDAFDQLGKGASLAQLQWRDLRFRTARFGDLSCGNFQLFPGAADKP